MLFCNVVIGTGVMVVPGSLNEISGSLDISVATAGRLISAAALLMCLGAPLFAAVVAGWDCRRVLALSMVWYLGAGFDGDDAQERVKQYLTANPAERQRGATAVIFGSMVKAFPC